MTAPPKRNQKGEATKRYEELSCQASAAIDNGNLKEALARFEGAQEIASKLADPARIDRTTCNRSAVLIELGRPASLRSELQEILMRSDDSEIRFLAAYTLSRDYESSSDPEKALFYARIANRHALDLKVTDRLAISHVRLAVLQISRCDFSAAESELLTAIALLPGKPSQRHVFAYDNLGYCYVMQRKFRKGFHHLFKSLRLARRLGSKRYETMVLTTLAFAYLQIGRPERGKVHSIRAQQLAEGVDDRAAMKPALFILGESYKQLGNPLGARRCFQRLEEEYYPQMPGVTDLLLVLNVQSFINIKG